jgi:hypothetical protein
MQNQIVFNMSESILPLQYVSDFNKEDELDGNEKIKGDYFTSTSIMD